MQKIYTAGLLVDSAYRLCQPGDILSRRLEQAVSLIQESIQDLRQNLVKLQPISSDKALSEQIRQLANDPRLACLISVDLVTQFRSGEPNLVLQANHIMAIIRESLSNVIRHSQASKVQIHVSSSMSEFILRIEDNGIGITKEPIKGFGLCNMNERARILGGRLELQNLLPSGTRLELIVPLNEAS